MKTKTVKEIAAFTGMLLAVSAVLLPLCRIRAPRADAAEAPVQESPVSTGYAREDGLFDDSIVHTIDLHITGKDWRYMTSHATDEEYVPCDAVIDGALVEHIAVRPKGNSSLSSISEQGSTHFSYKLEFDHYDADTTFEGLDKLCLNNLGQDPSCMKDFMAYHLMNDMGVAAPLSSYTLLQINGEDFGLYLAVEAVEDAFCLRNYGGAPGQLYKPDSFSMDTLDTGSMLDTGEGSPLRTIEQIMDGAYYAEAGPGERADILGAMLSAVFPPEQTAVAAMQYVGGRTEAYAAFWDSAVFHPEKSDKVRLVQSLETLSCSEDPQSVLDTDALLRYFAVHSFVNNYDGYTSMFVHNFYLHEQDGILSLVPWDYNLAFGSFTYEAATDSVLAGSGFDAMPFTGEAMDIDTSMINYPIDTPVYSVAMEDRPLLGVLLSDPETLAMYHGIYDALLREHLENGAYAALYDSVYREIRPYVADGLTFYDTGRFEQGAQAMRTYLELRTQAVRGQLDGSIPSTLDGQRDNAGALLTPEGLDLSDLADFASLKPELNAELISGVLHVFLQNEYAYTTQGAVEAVHDYAAHPTRLARRVPALLGIPAVRTMVLEKTAPVLVILVLLLGLLVTVLCVRRRKVVSSPLHPEDDPFFQ